MADEKGTWKRFKRLKLDPKRLAVRARRAETKTTRHAHRFVLSKLDSLRHAKQNIVLWLSIIAVLIAAILVQMTWFQKSYHAESWTPGGTYAEAVRGKIDTLNPLFATTESELSASKLLFSSLYKYDNTGHLKTDLASNVAISKDLSTYTVTLRDDVTWSDGESLTAEDVVFTVEKMQSPDVRSVMYRDWSQVQAEVVDSRTVKFVLPAAYASFPHTLTFAILPKHILRDVADENLRQSTYSINPTGSGPFELKVLQQSTDGSHKIANFGAREDYYEGAPLLSRFEIHAFENNRTMSRSIQAGEVNAASDLLGHEKSDNYMTQTYAVNNGVYVFFNNSSPIFKDKTVREALRYTTNTAKLRDSTKQATRPLDTPLLQSQVENTSLPSAPGYDLAKAKQLLKKAGWKMNSSTGILQKGKTVFEIRAVAPKESQYEAMLEELKNEWIQVGVSVTIETYDPENKTQDFVQQIIQPRSYDVLLYELVLGVDPDVFAYWHSSQGETFGYNLSNYDSTLSDDILSSARTRVDTKIRNEKYRDFAQQWIKDVPAIGVYQPMSSYVYGPSVNPVIPTNGMPSMSDRYTDVLYWAADKSDVYKTP